MPANQETGYEVLDNASNPLTSVHVPNTGVVAAQGSAVTNTDNAGIKSAPVVVSLASGVLDLGTLLNASAVTTTQTLSDQSNLNCRGVKIVLNMSNAGTGSITLEIDNKDTASGNYYAILTGAAVTSNGMHEYTVYPGAAVTANVSANDILAPTWRVKVTANNANATSYTIGGFLIV